MDEGSARTVNGAELRRYVRRITDRWQLEAAYLCPAASVGSGDDVARAGTDVPDAVSASGPSTALTDPFEDNSRFIVVLVSEAFDEVPWLERVHVASALWDADEMGASAEIHCYTAIELVRKQRTLRVVRQAVEQGVDLLAAPAA